MNKISKKTSLFYIAKIRGCIRNRVYVYGYILHSPCCRYHVSYQRQLRCGGTY